MSKKLTDLPDGVQTTIARKLSSANAINFSLANKALRSIIAPEVEKTHHMAFKKRVTDLTRAVCRLLDSIDKHVINARHIGYDFVIHIKFVVKDIIISAYVKKDCSAICDDAVVHVSYYNYDLENGISIKFAKRLLCVFLEEVLSTQPLLEQLKISVDMTLDFESVHLNKLLLAFYIDVSKKAGEHLISETKIKRQNEKIIDLHLHTKAMKTVMTKTEEKLPTLSTVFTELYLKAAAIYESLDAVLAFERTAAEGGARKITNKPAK